MPSIIKKLKVKQADGSLSDYINFGADATNVSLAEGLSLEELNDKLLRAEDYAEVEDVQGPTIEGLPVASAIQLGGVKVGSGLKITSDGILTPDTENILATREYVEQMIGEVDAILIDLIHGEGVN